MIKRALANPPVLYEPDSEEPLATQPTDIRVRSLESRLAGWVTFAVALVGAAEEDLSAYADFWFSTSSAGVEQEWAAYLADTATQGQLDTLHSHCLASAESYALLA